MKIVEKDTVDGYLKARDHHCCKIRILESRWTLSPLRDAPAKHSLKAEHIKQDKAT